MESFAELITALSSLAWPVLFGILAFKFYKPIKTLIESAKNRKFTFKVAGNELTMEEASEQQILLISDLQAKLAAMEKHLMANKSLSTPIKTNKDELACRILWVDDTPKNNSYFLASLREMGHGVDIALSTDEGIRKFKDHTYDIVISDMGRPEDKKAGVTLAKEIRALKSDVPFYIFCGTWAAKHMKQEALSAGVTDITASGTTLLSWLPLTQDD